MPSVPIVKDCRNYAISLQVKRKTICKEFTWFNNVPRSTKASGFVFTMKKKKVTYIYSPK